jgi:hypothetical protein
MLGRVAQHILAVGPREQYHNVLRTAGKRGNACQGTGTQSLGIHPTGQCAEVDHPRPLLKQLDNTVD